MGCNATSFGNRLEECHRLLLNSGRRCSDAPKEDGDGWGCPWVLSQRGRGRGWRGDIPEAIPGSRGKNVFTRQNLFPALNDGCDYP